ncbi:DUF1127 domain-containing protein [Paracoccus panacisoli]|uniref:Uncharacterized conserved protein YjiS, DUF1127 family n=2 Tax=Paracoccus TaxID=265 RepID=A0A099FY29_9RHOB|nr:DUF1127 domain-containing protein [Paracoccus sanguinis]KGJ11956.1 hypothetical protein IX54_15575 [Paracoccus sanguinis]KGJ15485.1 hypothetical protein IX57_15210 [Paracoccus sanguinis]KGJ19581.1 hypothetical protein IX55_09785 [Paracoccus sanguinis]QJD16956.1 DUF1127 domain-containing protein [Paracoccus sanguinis]SDW52142.1 Uncharacterized conserved protein YjiS, DUF1127 family [Paracoccus sanguinis]
MSAVETLRLPAASRPGLLSRLGAAFAHWAEVRETRSQLNRLTDRELTDIGLSRADIEHVARGL